MRRCFTETIIGRSCHLEAVIEIVAMKIPLHSIKIEYINPKGTATSKEHDEVMRRYGLDRHIASTCLIALRGIERHTMIQKAIT